MNTTNCNCVECQIANEIEKGQKEIILLELRIFILNECIQAKADKLLAMINDRTTSKN